MATSNFVLASPHRLAGGLVAGLGLAALVAWALGAEALTAIVPGAIAMNPLTAIGFVLAGFAVAGIGTSYPGAREVALACAWAVVAGGLGGLVHRSLGVGPALDLMFFPDAVAAATPPNRIALGTVAGFTLVGLALVLAHRRRDWPRAQVLAILAGLVALVTWCQYIYAPVTDPAPRLVAPVALSTAVGMALLVAGLLVAAPHEGVMRLLHTGSASALVARRLLSAAVLVPVGLGWLRLMGERAGAFSTEVGVALTVAATAGMLVFVVLWTATAVDRAETRRRDVEDALRAHAREVDDLYHNAPCGYHSLDERGMFVRMNDTELGWLGYARDEVIGRLTFADLLTPEGRARFAETFPRFKATGEIRDIEFDLVRKNGTTFRVAINATAVRDERARYVSSRSTVFDITARTEAARRIASLNADLAHRLGELAHINGELEAFSYSVSHDLRAPLRHIAGFASLLERHAGTLDAKSQHYVQVIVESAQTMGQLIDDLLSFSRMSRAEMTRRPVALAELVGEVRRDLENDIDGRRVVWRVGALPEVHADRAMLRVVLRNLLQNAVKYTRSRDEAVIEIGAADDDGGDSVVFVRDNGVGFDMTYVDRLFGVFQRLHRAEEFEGTGIGLATVRRIVARHGGRTWAEGAVDRGATVYFSIPRHTEGA